MAVLTYSLVWGGNTSFCIGVKGQPDENAPLTLVLNDARYSTWLMDADSGYIRLRDVPDYVLSVQGPAGINVPLCLLPRLSVESNQQWDWLSKPPGIYLSDSPGLCIDNQDGIAAVDNPVQICNSLNNQNQEWQLRPAL